MTSPALIRRLREDEVEALAGLAREIWLHHYAAIISPEQIDYMLAQRYAPALIRSQLANPDHGWWVAEQDGSLVGFTHTVRTEEQCKLDKLYVHPHHQRHGLGAALLEQAKAWTRQAGRTRLTLQVNRHNALALSAYRKYGFVVTEARVFDIGGGFVMDDYFMELKLE
jgi:GNAT superfamily N-acetyltransferase